MGPVWVLSFATLVLNGLLVESISVTIVGGGMAGISAARYLMSNYTQSVLNVTVLEASPLRFGGRMWSVPIPGYTDKFFEFGANWLHGATDPSQPIVQYVRSHNIPTTLNVVDKTNVEAYFGNSTNVFAGNNYFDTYINTFNIVANLGQIGAFKANQPEKSIADVLQDKNSKLAKRIATLSPEMQAYFVLFMEDEEGTALRNISTTAYPDEEDTTEEYAALDAGYGDVVTSGGYVSVVKSLAQGAYPGDKPVNIKLGEQVNSIATANKKVTIKTTSGNTYVSDYAIVAVPLGVLKANSIAFTPALKKKKTDAIKRMGFGNFVKLFILFDKQFWPTDKDFLFYFPTYNNGTVLNLPRVYFVSLSRLLNVTGLVGIMNGQYADLADALDDNALKSQIQQVLQVMYPNYATVKPQMTYFNRSSWAKNPLVNGAYSYGRIGMKESDPETVRSPIKNRIFFAGEHCMYDEGTSASVVGAYESGIDTAEQLIDVLP